MNNNNHVENFGNLQPNRERMLAELSRLQQRFHELQYCGIVSTEVMAMMRVAQRKIVALLSEVQKHFPTDHAALAAEFAPILRVELDYHDSFSEKPRLTMAETLRVIGGKD